MQSHTSVSAILPRENTIDRLEIAFATNSAGRLLSTKLDTARPKSMI